MKVIDYAQITCDNCGKSLVAMSTRTKPPTEFNIKMILRRLEALAGRHLWQMEGPSIFAGDFCSICKGGEQPSFRGVLITRDVPTALEGS